MGFEAARGVAEQLGDGVQVPVGRGRVDVLVLLADDQQWLEPVAFHAPDASALDAIRAILPGMLERGRGDVVNMSSISAIRMVPDQAPYSASKAGVHMLSDIIRGELAETPIRVTEIMPGLTRTDIVKSRHRGDEDAARKYFERFGMALDPEDVARCVMFALDQPSHMQIAQMFVLPANRW